MEGGRDTGGGKIWSTLVGKTLIPGGESFKGIMMLNFKTFSILIMICDTQHDTMLMGFCEEPMRTHLSRLTDLFALCGKCSLPE